MIEFEGISTPELEAIGIEILVPDARAYLTIGKPNPYGRHLDARELFDSFLRIVERWHTARRWRTEYYFEYPLPHAFVPAIASSFQNYIEAVKRNILELSTSLNLTSTDILTDSRLREEVLSHAYPHLLTDSRRA